MPREQFDLTLRRDPVLVQDALRRQAVDQHDELMRGLVDVAVGGELAALGRLVQVAAQPVAQPVEL